MNGIDKAEIRIVGSVRWRVRSAPGIRGWIGRVLTFALPWMTERFDLARVTPDFFPPIELPAGFKIGMDGMGWVFVTYKGREIWGRPFSVAAPIHLRDEPIKGVVIDLTVNRF